MSFLNPGKQKLDAKSMCTKERGEFSAVCGMKTCENVAAFQEA